jgi:hypothetical protein
MAPRNRLAQAHYVFQEAYWVHRGSEDAPRFAWSLGYLSEFLSSCLKHVWLVALWLVVACERQAVFCHSAKGDPSTNNLIARRLAAFEAHDVVKGAWWR